MTGKYAVIDEFAAGGEGFPIVSMCGWLGVSRSGFYEWRTRPDSATTNAAGGSPRSSPPRSTRGRGSYGHRRVQAQLARWQEPAGLGLIRRLMRDLDLVACQPQGLPDHHPRRPGRRRHAGPAATGTSPPTGPGSAWSATSPTSEPGKAGCTWRPSSTATTGVSIGWAMADHMRAGLVRNALTMAAGNVLLVDAVFHSDRGTQYTSAEYRRALAVFGVRPEHRPDRGVLGQRLGGVILRGVEERTRVPNRVSHPSARPPRRCRIHRSLLQSGPAPLRTRVPDPYRGLPRIPGDPSSSLDQTQQVNVRKTRGRSVRQDRPTPRQEEGRRRGRPLDPDLASGTSSRTTRPSSMILGPTTTTPATAPPAPSPTTSTDCANSATRSPCNQPPDHHRECRPRPNTVQLADLITGWMLRLGPGCVVGTFDVPLGHLAFDDSRRRACTTGGVEPAEQPPEEVQPVGAVASVLVRGGNRPGGRRSV